MLMITTAHAQAVSYQEVALRLQQLSESNGKVEKGPIDGIIRLFGENRLISSMALHRLVTTRCERYLPWPESRRCDSNVWDMIDVLDMDMHILRSKDVPAYNLVVFKQKLVELLRLPSTGVYLQTLAQQWQDSQRGSDHRFNLWDFTVNHLGKADSALELLAVLFQDTTLPPSHLEFLARENIPATPHFLSNLGHLNQLIEMMAQLRETRPELYKQRVYPPQLGGQLNSNFYHLYVPWYVAKSLQRRGLSARDAAVPPFMLAATYEFITSGSDYRYLLSDPKTMTSSWTVQDIYAAELAVSRSPSSFNDVLKLFAQQTRAAMQSIVSRF